MISPIYLSKNEAIETVLDKFEDKFYEGLIQLYKNKKQTGAAIKPKITKKAAVIRNADDDQYININKRRIVREQQVESDILAVINLINEEKNKKKNSSGTNASMTRNIDAAKGLDIYIDKNLKPDGAIQRLYAIKNQDQQYEGRKAWLIENKQKLSSIQNQETKKKLSNDLDKIDENLNSLGILLNAIADNKPVSNDFLTSLFKKYPEQVEEIYGKVPQTDLLKSYQMVALVSERTKEDNDKDTLYLVKGDVKNNIGNLQQYSASYYDPIKKSGYQKN